MVEQKMAISKVQNEIVNLPDRFTEGLEALIATRNGKKVLAILPYDMYKALLETIETLLEMLEIMKDEEAVAALRESIQALECGETITWKDMQQQSDLLKNEGKQK